MAKSKKPATTRETMPKFPKPKTDAAKKVIETTYAKPRIKTPKATPTPIDKPTRKSVEDFLRGAKLNTWSMADDKPEVRALYQEYQRLEKEILETNVAYQTTKRRYEEAYEKAKAEAVKWNERVDAALAQFRVNGLTPRVKAMLKLLTDERFPELTPKAPETENVLPRVSDTTDAPPVSQLDGAPDR